ncbi:MAG TPA: methyltransferase domain-containing protein [Vicinamibacterales bacterium]|nr:methyltransferase domain-containing protein [Vicinamibacterales bacterium]
MQLRRLDPLGGGRQRGEPVIRYYWRVFLDQHRQDVRGRALEIGSSETLTRYGNGAVQAAEVLDIAPRPGVSVVADLTRADDLASDTYDCFVVPFTAHLLFDVDAALYHAIRLLKPGGVLLINFPCVDYNFARGVDMGTGKPLFVFWWFTPLQVENLLRRAGLQAGDFEIAIYGNLFARVAYQMNMPAEELTASERGHADPGHPLLICVRVVKPAQWSVARPDYREAWVPDVTPAQWNRRTGHYPGP